MSVMRGQIAGESARALAARTLGPVHIEWQADHERGDAKLCGKPQDRLSIRLELDATDRFQRATRCGVRRR